MARTVNTNDPLGVNSAPSDDEFVVLAPKGGVAGNSINNWTQQWWNWAVQNTSFDWTQPGAGMDVAGRIAFLGGSWGGGAINDVTVDAGSPILIPVFNTLMSQFNGNAHIYGNAFNSKSFDTGTPAFVNDGFADAWKASTTNVYLKIDGHSVDVANDFSKSSWFTVDPGAAWPFGDTPWLKCQSKGYWIVLSGLSKSDHTIQFGGSSQAFTFGGHDFAAFSVDIRDTVHVA